jgi:hypothetical protein
MEARKIVIDEKNNEVAVPADKVFPEDVVEYTLRYRNTSKSSRRLMVNLSRQSPFTLESGEEGKIEYKARIK